MRRVLLLSGAWASLLPGAVAQPCPAGSSVTSYRKVPVPNAFASLLGLGGTVNVFLPPTDDATTLVPFPPGFAFSFFGVAKTQVGIGSNGFLTFETPPSTSATNLHPGDGAPPNDAIFAWHDDLVLQGAGSSVDYRFDLAPGAQTLTVQWTGVGNFVATGPPLVGRGAFTFQCRLYSSTHASLPDRIDFRYDRSTAPPVMAPCQTTSAGTTATTATIGCESASPISALNVGVEPTYNGAANGTFPSCDIRLVPASFAMPGRSATAALVAQEPFCHIDGLPGTVALPPPCLGGTCFDDTNWSEVTGSVIEMGGRWIWVMNGHQCFANPNSNGFLALGRGTAFANFANAAIPAVAEPDLMLAPFWDDLEGHPGSGMFHRVDGVPGCRVFTFEWHDFGRFTGAVADCVPSAGSVTMQVKIFEAGAGSLASSAGSCPYDLVVPGIGNDRIEFHYDHASFVPASPTPFSATIGIENHNGTLGFSCLPGSANAAPPAGMKCVITNCDTGLAHSYGNRNTNGAGCLPHAMTNIVPPVIGNPFGLQILGGSPLGLSFFLLDFGGPLPGSGTPVPCGGLPSPFGTFWVNPFAPTSLILPCGSGILSPGGPCEGGCALDLPIPLDPTIVGAVVFAQGAVVLPSPAGLLFELTEGMKITVG